MCLTPLQNLVIKMYTVLRKFFSIHLEKKLLWLQLSFTCWTTRNCQQFYQKMFVHRRTWRHSPSTSFQLRPFALDAQGRSLFLLIDVTTYCKRCGVCGQFYWYQEWTEGLHNFNDHTILTLHLCLFLRQSVQVIFTFAFMQL